MCSVTPCHFLTQMSPESLALMPQMPLKLHRLSAFNQSYDYDYDADCY